LLIYSVNRMMNGIKHYDLIQCASCGFEFKCPKVKFFGFISPINMIRLIIAMFILTFLFVVLFFIKNMKS